MMNLCLILPLVLGPRVQESDDPRWYTFLKLVQITWLCTSPCCDRTSAALLGQLVQEHNHDWCLRFEGKHAFFKSKNLKCFKNASKTLSMKHQKYMCHKQRDQNGLPSVNFLYRGKVVKAGKEIDILETHPYLIEHFSQFFETNVPQLPLYETPQIEICGHTYAPGCCLVESYKDGFPKFVRLVTILVRDNETYFVTEGLQVEVFERHMLAYRLSPLVDYGVIKWKSLFSKWPLSVHEIENKLYVVNKYSHRCEFI